MSTRAFRVSIVVASVLLSTAIWAGRHDRGPAPTTDEFEPSWLLVQLDRPIGEPAADGSFLLGTGLSAVDTLIREAGIWRIESALPVSSRAPADPEAFRRWGFDRTYKFFVPAGADIPKLVRQFRLAAGVRYSEPDFVIEALPPSGGGGGHGVSDSGETPPGTDDVFPNDPLFSGQWALHNTGQDGGTTDCDVDAPEAWETSTGEGVIIAVLSSGCDSDHPDLDGKYVPGYDFWTGDADPEDEEGRGTQQASIAAAETDNGEGIAGVCWNCRIMPLRVGFYTYVTSSDLADATVWATDHGARVVIFAYGAFLSPSSMLLNGVGYAYDAGVVQVNSVGRAAPSGGPLWYPAGYPETIAVSASDRDDWRFGEANYGAEVDVIAPGVDIPQAEVGGGYRNDCFGYCTDYSPPFVAGLVGIMETVNPSIGLEEARHLIQMGADDQVGDPGQDTPGFDDYYGWGRINMDNTLHATAASMTLRVEGTAATRVYFDSPNPLADSYDFARGDLGTLTESHMGVDVGELMCIENDSADADTAGDEDTDTPDPGEAFFYVARFNAAPGAGSYGGSSRNRDRMVFSNRTEADWIAESGQQGAFFGAAYAAGDVNNDGFDDVIVGANEFSQDFENEGAAFLYLGSASGLVTTHAWMTTGGQASSLFGWTAGPAGDVNGDGYDDVIVGAPTYDNGENDEGMAFVYHGGPSGLSDTPDWTADSDQAGAQFGFCARGVGDVNGDRFDDVLVSAVLFDAGQVDEGRVFLYFGSESGLSETADWSAESDQANARMGRRFAAAGNINGDVDGEGDPLHDIVVGAPSYSNGQSEEGRLFVYHGSNSGPGATPDYTIEIDVPGARFGSVTAGAGDVDGDDFDDVIVGAPLYASGQPDEGAVFLYRGSATGLLAPHAWSFQSDQAGARLGLLSTTAGDINDDGHDDVVAGAYLFDDLRSDEGKVWVFLGSSSGLSTEPVWTMTGRQSLSDFGAWGGPAGDVNGDGKDDLILGAVGYDGSEFEEGRAYLYEGPLTETTSADCPD